MTDVEKILTIRTGNLDSKAVLRNYFKLIWN